MLLEIVITMSDTQVFHCILHFFLSLKIDRYVMFVLILSSLKQRTSVNANMVTCVHDTETLMSQSACFRQPGLSFGEYFSVEISDQQIDYMF